MAYSLSSIHELVASNASGSTTMEAALSPKVVGRTQFLSAKTGSTKGKRYSPEAHSIQT